VTNGDPFFLLTAAKLLTLFFDALSAQNEKSYAEESGPNEKIP
jgi:hypothetical protein